MINKIIGIGNTTGTEIDKFEIFNLTPQPRRKVKAPLIKECFAHFECKVIDVSLLKK